MTNRTHLTKASTLTNFNSIKLESPNPTLNDFSIIENLYITKETCLKRESKLNAMYIFILTRNREKASFDEGRLDVQNQSTLYLGTNSIHEMPIEGQSFLLSGVCFTSNFIEETQITLRAAPHFFNLFSTDSFQVWELEPEDNHTIQHHIRSLADYAKRVSRNPFGKEILIHTFLAFLFEIEALHLKHVGPAPVSRQDIHVHKFQHLVQQQFRKVRAIKDYADQLNISAKYLTEIVKQSVGKNASELITESVINEAKALLKNPNLSIGEIADQLHFSDPSFFGKYFRRQTGIAPKIYRESMKSFGDIALGIPSSTSFLSEKRA